MTSAAFVLTLLLQAGSQPAVATPVSADAAKPVCRRIDVTGSLVRKERVCKTPAEWREIDYHGNRYARAIVEYSQGRPSGQ